MFSNKAEMFIKIQCNLTVFKMAFGRIVATWRQCHRMAKIFCKHIFHVGNKLHFLEGAENHATAQNSSPEHY